MEYLSDDIILNISKFIKLSIISKRFYRIESEFKTIFEINLKNNPIKITFNIIKFEESLLSINSVPKKITEKKESYYIDNIETLGNRYHLKNLLKNINNNRTLNIKKNNLLATYYLIDNIKSEDNRYDYKHLF